MTMSEAHKTVDEFVEAVLKWARERYSDEYASAFAFGVVTTYLADAIWRLAELQDDSFLAEQFVEMIKEETKKYGGK